MCRDHGVRNIERERLNVIWGTSYADHASIVHSCCLVVSFYFLNIFALLRWQGNTRGLQWEDKLSRYLANVSE